ncbi:hypothetical protein ACFL2U_03645 [Patescibacteria group bacterium]
MYKKRAILALFLSVSSAFLGVMGLFGWCCTITGAVVLSILGLASISTYLVYYNIWFLLFALFFFILSIILFIKHQHTKKCMHPIKNVKKHKTKN